MDYKDSKEDALVFNRIVSPEEFLQAAKGIMEEKKWSILSGLKQFGLGELENVSLYEKPDPKEIKKGYRCSCSKKLIYCLIKNTSARSVRQSLKRRRSVQARREDWGQIRICVPDMKG